MNCVDLTEWIARKLDGTLSESRLRELDEHLSTCRRCRNEVLLQEKILEALSEEEPSGLSVDFTRRVSEKALEMTHKKRAWPIWPALVPAFAFGAAALLIIILGTDLPRILPQLWTTLGQALSGPVGWAGDSVSRFLAGIADLSRPVLEQLSPASLSILVACLIGTIPMIWAFQRMFAFLRD